MISRTANQLLAHDAAMPQRGVLLDVAKMSKLFASRLGRSVDRCEIRRTKYRFGANLRLLYNIELANSSLQISARTGASTIRGKDQVIESGSSCGIDAMWRDESLNTLFCIFPRDRKISNLDVLDDPPQSLRVSPLENWATSRVIAYAPEKCATVQCLNDAGNILAYAKVYSGDEGRRIFDVYKSLEANDLNYPKAIAYSHELRTILLEAVSGPRLADISNESDPVIYTDFGAAIARLHSVRPPTDLPKFDRLGVEKLSHVLAKIVGPRPELTIQASSFAKLLSTTYRSDGKPDVLLHGDVHAKNAIWSDGRLVLIDLDQVSIGNAACDIGSFFAGLYYKRCTGELTDEGVERTKRSFVSGYAAVCELPSAASLRWHTAMALFAERAARSIGRIREEGLNHLAEILEAGRKILETGD